MSGLALRDFFAGPLPGAELAARLGGAPTGQALADAIDAALESVLDTPMDDVLLGSWKKAGEVREALAESRRAPASLAVLPLAEHTIASTHTPALTLFYGRKRLAELSLQIDLELTLRGICLEFRGGKVAGLRAGECAGVGAISLAGQSVVERETPAIDLPGRLAFGRRKP